MFSEPPEFILNPQLPYQINSNDMALQKAFC